MLKLFWPEMSMYTQCFLLCCFLCYHNIILDIIKYFKYAIGNKSKYSNKHISWTWGRCFARYSDIPVTDTAYLLSFGNLIDLIR